MTNIARDAVCETCLFFRSYGTGSSGECRRFPPQVNMLSDDGGPTTDFPVVTSKEWCGEHPQFRSEGR
jgi:hypothetical protein